MTETQKLDAWYAEQRASGNVTDIRFSLSASGRDATVETLARPTSVARRKTKVVSPIRPSVSERLTLSTPHW